MHSTPGLVAAKPLGNRGRPEVGLPFPTQPHLHQRTSSFQDHFREAPRVHRIDAGGGGLCEESLGFGGSQHDATGAYACDPRLRRNPRDRPESARLLRLQGTAPTAAIQAQRHRGRRGHRRTPVVRAGAGADPHAGLVDDAAAIWPLARRTARRHSRCQPAHAIHGTGAPRGMVVWHSRCDDRRRSHLLPSRSATGHEAAELAPDADGSPVTRHDRVFLAHDQRVPAGQTLDADGQAAGLLPPRSAAAASGACGPRHLFRRRALGACRCESAARRHPARHRPNARVLV